MGRAVSGLGDRSAATRAPLAVTVIVFLSCFTHETWGLLWRWAARHDLENLDYVHLVS